MNVYLGIDVGSVSTNLVLINDHQEVIYTSYLRTRGRPIEALKSGLIKMLTSPSGYKNQSSRYYRKRQAISGINSRGGYSKK